MKDRRNDYNATVVATRDVHQRLRILRVKPDRPLGPIEPGQYTVLGLGAWEPAGGAAGTATGGQAQGIIKRSYSLSCSLLDSQQRLQTVEQFSYCEFYLNLVDTHRREQALSPRLFALTEGDRILMGPKITGRYTLAGVPSSAGVVLVATGTGEAPHNAMVAELLSRRHAGRIVSIVCVRHKKDLAYLPAHRELERRHANYRYLVHTTRDPENLDPAAPGYVGKQRLQQLFTSGEFERRADYEIQPRETHVFLCGNPAMIGAPRRASGGVLMPPDPEGMVALLLARGLQLDQPRQPGNIHFESYW